MGVPLHRRHDGRAVQERGPLAFESAGCSRQPALAVGVACTRSGSAASSGFTSSTRPLGGDFTDTIDFASSTTATPPPCFTSVPGALGRHM